jgi:hypothetical protein
MKKIVVIVGICLLLINSVAILIISDYYLFNYLLIDFVIIYTFTFLYLLNVISIKDGYRITLGFAYPILLLIKIFFAIISPPIFLDNYLLLIILIICLVELLIFLSVKYLNKYA